jgi:hypothetical protein
MNKLGDKFKRFLTFQLPSLLIWGSYISLITFNLQTALQGQLFFQIFPILLTCIAICLGFASTSFSYAKTIKDPEDKKIIEIGECFLYTAVTLIGALSISWLSFQISSRFEYKWLTILFNSMANFCNAIYLGAGTFRLYTAIINLESFLELKRPSSLRTI